MKLDDLAPVTLVAGAPRCGKTDFALHTLIDAMKRYGDDSAVMTVQGRQIADDLGDRVIRELSAVSQARPVTTLPAVAFRIVTAVRSRAGLALPKLLNGAEQDMIIRRVLAAHVEHVNRGDECGTCDLLRTYFAVAQWSGMLVDDSTDAFADQLRDMLARMNEIGAKPEYEEMLIAKAVSGDAVFDERHERLRTQWRLAFVLRAEYEDAIRAAYPDEYRLDASQLMVDAVASVGEAHDDDLPKLLIVDDFQDATLAGFDMLAALHDKGVRLLLVGNPDESVQVFRGSYPEYLFNAARSRLGARLERFETVDERTSYRTLAATRVSLSIASMEETDDAIANRPGKMPMLPGALPIAPATDIPSNDGSVETALYRSASEELDDVVWKIKTEHLHRDREWNDMVLIAHDNATARTFGERLRADGVPVRYSSVTRPLKDESFVQGLFALIELSQLRQRTIAASKMDLAAAGAYVRSRVALIMDSPLITVGGERPARLSAVESAMNALSSLAAVLRSEDSSVASDQALLPLLIADWEDYVARSCSSDPSDPSADDSDDAQFSIGALYVLLLEGNSERVLDAIASVMGHDPQFKAFASLWKVLDKTVEAESGLISREPQYVLDCAWKACGKAQVWQRMSLENSAAGRAANDRLDAAMRLFSYASGDDSKGTMAARTIGEFMEQVRSLAIEADSLAHTAPIDQAVTLTTPAGAAGRHWNLVFMPSVQQGQWPNLTPRNTLFGGESLADVMLHERLSDEVVTSAGRRDTQLEAVLASEQKSFLVALTRADERVMLSAVLNDDAVPSDFLYGYLPERFSRERDADLETREYAVVGGADDFGGLDADSRGLIAAARSVLACEPAGSAKARDAAEALALLVSRGVKAADPNSWPFAGRHGSDGDARSVCDARNISDDSRGEHVVTVSPSAVDKLWGCPVCWMLENRFAGPQAGSVAASFGSVIHDVLRKASEEGLDLPGRHTDVSDVANIEAVTRWMLDEYGRQRGDLEGISDPAQRYAALRKSRDADEVLRNAATYFVTSNRTGYPAKNNDKFEVGRLESVEVELKFTAKFDFDDILAAYNAIDGISPIRRDEIIDIMGLLVGGWPETGMSERLKVRLSGRIDRLEHRRTSNGKEQVRLIDYKTGGKPAAEQLFSDLQLVCYQLGLAFPEDGGKRGTEAIAAMPDIAQSALFHVGEESAPAQRGVQGDEAYHQQALFSAGSLNTGGFVARSYVTGLDKIFKDGLDGAEKPPRVSDEHWQQFLQLRPTMAVWSLTMIARIFYTAAASRSDEIHARPTKEHKEHCKYRSVCPACAEEQNTVFERRTA